VAKDRLRLVEQLDAARESARTHEAAVDQARKDAQEAEIRAEEAKKREAEHKSANSLLRRELETLRPAVQKA